MFTPSGGAESTIINKEVEVPKPNESAYLEVEDWNDAVQLSNQQTTIINTVIIYIFLMNIHIYFQFCF